MSTPIPSQKSPSESSVPESSVPSSNVPSSNESESNESKESESKESESNESNEPSLKYAKSMSGHVYAYAVHTVGEFKQKVSEAYRIPSVLLTMLLHEDDEEGQERQESQESQERQESQEALQDDDLLKENVIYALFMHAAKNTLLPWIDSTQLNYHMRIENPSYFISETEAARLTPDEIDYLAIFPNRIDIVTQYSHRLSETGWRRLFVNTAAPPFLEKMYATTVLYFHKHAPLLASNTEAIPLLQRLLQDECPIYRPDIFWRNISRNTNVGPLLKQYSESIDITSLSSNPAASPYIMKQIELYGEDHAIQFNWHQISMCMDYRPLLFGYPQLVNRLSIQYNPYPIAVEWMREHIPVHKIHWDTLCNHRDPAFIAFIEENLDWLTPSGWNTLCLNPAAISLLKRHPENIHWTLLCCNPSEEVIPMVEEYLTTSSSSILSDECSSLIGLTFVRNHIRESYQQKDVCHSDRKHDINCGAISFHPHSLPLLKKMPSLIYWNALSVRPDIYEDVTASLL